MPVISIFSPFTRVFYLSRKVFLFLSYIYTVVCKHFQFERVFNLSFGKGLSKVLVKKIQEIMDRCTGYHNITEKTLKRHKIPFNQSINQFSTVWADINPLPNNKPLDANKLKAFADNLKQY